MIEENLPVEPEVELGHSPPLRWIMITRTGHEVVMVRLIHFNFLRLYAELAVPGESVNSSANQEVIAHISKEWIALRKFVKYISPEQEFPDDTNGDRMSLWICIPSPDSRWYKTNRQKWNTIIRRWPQFLDEEWVAENFPSDAIE